MKKILCIVLVLALCAAWIPTSPAWADAFPSSDLNQYIADSRIDWEDQIRWTEPDLSKGHIFGNANRFAVFTLGDFSVQRGAEVTGKMAVGGVLRNRGPEPMRQLGLPNGPGNGIASHYYRTDVNFLVGDHVDGYAQIYGWIASRNASDLTQTDGGNLSQVNFEIPDSVPEVKPGYYIYGAYPVSAQQTTAQMLEKYFQDAGKSIENMSQRYLKIAAGTKGKIQWTLGPESRNNELTLTGEDTRYNVFDITLEQFRKMQFLKLNVPADSYVQINVIGEGEISTDLSGAYRRTARPYKNNWSPNANYAPITIFDSDYQAVFGKDSLEQCSRLFWNMPDITRLTLEKNPFPGTILAPKAHLQMNCPNTNGNVIVKSVESNYTGGEFHFYPFDYSEMPAVEIEGEQTISVSVTKKWVGGSTDSVTVQLLQNKKSIQVVHLSAAKDWKHVFEDLPLKDDSGKPYTYTVKEAPVEGFTGAITGDVENGFVITNTKKETEPTTTTPTTPTTDPTTPTTGPTTPTTGPTTPTTGPTTPTTGPTTPTTGPTTPTTGPTTPTTGPTTPTTGPTTPTTGPTTPTTGPTTPTTGPTTPTTGPTTPTTGPTTPTTGPTTPTTGPTTPTTGPTTPTTGPTTPTTGPTTPTTGPTTPTTGPTTPTTGPTTPTTGPTAPTTGPTTPTTGPTTPTTGPTTPTTGPTTPTTGPTTPTTGPTTPTTGPTTPTTGPTAPTTGPTTPTTGPTTPTTGPTTPTTGPTTPTTAPTAPTTVPNTDPTEGPATPETSGPVEPEETVTIVISGPGVPKPDGPLILEITQNGQVIETVPVEVDGPWEVTVPGLPGADEEGHVHQYGVLISSECPYNGNVTGNVPQGFQVGQITLGTPATGDEMPVMLCLWLLAAAGMGTLGLTALQKRQRRRR